jgi:hypothetical protein
MKEHFLERLVNLRASRNCVLKKHIIGTLTPQLITLVGEQKTIYRSKEIISGLIQCKLELKVNITLADLADIIDANMTKLFIQTQDPGESPYPYYIATPDAGNMYFNSKKEAKAFIEFYHDYHKKKAHKTLNIDTTDV